MTDKIQIKKGHVFINETEINQVEEIKICFMPNAHSEVAIKFLADTVTVDQEVC
ncbi:hypothetical protein [Lapidilactobacillus bayanensis]|uniref:hypothetical protein n=1 Tax=Lapidilactobacillus bayanensis TaxID=2485998 RepID=UPI0013DE4D58|nr:hypothetical protein [Lapidilactobacillus bayanensis]